MKAYLMVALCERDPDGPRNQPAVVGFDIFSDEHPTRMRSTLLATVHVTEGKDFQEAKDKMMAWIKSEFPWIVVARG